MKRVSVITVSYNTKNTIGRTIESVASQTYPDIEHIVVDGGSTDGTVEVVRTYGNSVSKLISEKDEGMYDGINKGIGMASGDIIGTLNADDRYAHDKVIAHVVDAMGRSGAEVCWGDLVYVEKDHPEKVLRYWKSGEYTPGKFRNGWMPPHPTFFVRREVYEEYGLFNLDFPIAADYELMLRFLERFRVSSCYIPKILVTMSEGGVSNRNVWSMIRANTESYRAWKVNGLRIFPLRILLKPLSKVFQITWRKKTMDKGHIS